MLWLMNMAYRSVIIGLPVQFLRSRLPPLPIKSRFQFHQIKIIFWCCILSVPSRPLLFLLCSYFKIQFKCYLFLEVFHDISLSAQQHSLWCALLNPLYIHLFVSKIILLCIGLLPGHDECLKGREIERLHFGCGLSFVIVLLASSMAPDIY